MVEPGAAYIADFLKSNDRDRYFATLLLPEPERAAVQALYAFNADVAAVSGRVSDPAAGEIRLQWWHDALSGEGHGDVARNPLAAALLEALGRYRIPSAPLLRLLSARRFDLYQDQMPDVPTFEGYAGETVSVLYQLTAMVLNGGAPADSTADAAGHLGVAHALTGHVRAFGYNASRGRIFLPWSVLGAAGVNEGEVFAGVSSEGLAVALEQLCDLAAEHLAKAEAAVGALPKDLRSAFAMIAIIRLDLRAARAAIETPFAVPQPILDWRKIASLSWWNLRR